MRKALAEARKRIDKANRRVAEAEAEVADCKKQCARANADAETAWATGVHVPAASQHVGPTSNASRKATDWAVGSRQTPLVSNLCAMNLQP